MNITLKQKMAGAVLGAAIIIFIANTRQKASAPIENAAHHFAVTFINQSASILSIAGPPSTLELIDISGDSLDGGVAYRMVFTLLSPKGRHKIHASVAQNDASWRMHRLLLLDPSGKAHWIINPDEK